MVAPLGYLDQPIAGASTVPMRDDLMTDRRHPVSPRSPSGIGAPIGGADGARH